MVRDAPREPQPRAALLEAGMGTTSRFSDSSLRFHSWLHYETVLRAKLRESGSMGQKASCRVCGLLDVLGKKVPRARTERGWRGGKRERRREEKGGNGNSMLSLGLPDG